MTLLSETQELYKKFQEEQGIFDDRIQRAIGPIIDHFYQRIKESARNGKTTVEFKLYSSAIVKLGLSIRDTREVGERIHNILRKREDLTVYLIDNGEYITLNVSGWA